MRYFPFYFLKKIYKLKYLVFKYVINTKNPLKSIYGIYLTPSFKDVTFMYYLKGTYGFFLSDLIKNISNDSTFIDIGANQGLFSILAGKNENIKEIIAFEPAFKTAELLRSNLECNQILNCTVIEKGISNKTGSLQLNTTEGHSGRSTFRELKAGDNTRNESVETINHEEIDKLIRENTNYIIKIDVEGHEEIVIDELIKCSFFKNVSLIFCEIDTAWVDVETIKKKLFSSGFSKIKKIGRGESHYDILISRN